MHGVGQQQNVQLWASTKLKARDNSKCFLGRLVGVGIIDAFKQGTSIHGKGEVVFLLVGISIDVSARRGSCKPQDCQPYPSYGTGRKEAVGFDPCPFSRAPALYFLGDQVVNPGNVNREFIKQVVSNKTS